MKFRLIEDQREPFPVRVMCDVMGASPEGYYAWRGGPESPANRSLLIEIQRVHMAHHRRYGAPRIHAPSRAGGTQPTVAASNASCVITASGQYRRGGFLYAPPDSLSIGVGSVGLKQELHHTKLMKSLMRSMRTNRDCSFMSS
jgi:hypothetical protein